MLIRHRETLNNPDGMQDGDGDDDSDDIGSNGLHDGDQNADDVAFTKDIHECSQTAEHAKPRPCRLFERSCSDHHAF
eukprot:scaffold9174_cov18-Tisochrysis_lutea.AAC.1